jgi:hypothetical protein
LPAVGGRASKCRGRAVVWTRSLKRWSASYASAVRRVLGVLLVVIGVLFGLTFLDIFLTKLTAGSWTSYYAMALYGAATVGYAVGARSLLRGRRVPSDC